MCTNYAPSARELAEQFVPLVRSSGQWPVEVYKDYQGPIIRRVADDDEGGGGFELLAGNYSMRPKRFRATAEIRPMFIHKPEGNKVAGIRPEMTHKPPRNIAGRLYSLLAAEAR